jgi:nucleotide-binding universal stress UspA family protein
MKLLVGIDETRRHCAAFNLIARLQFPDPKVELVYVSPSAANIASAYTAYIAVDVEGVMEELRDGGQKLLDAAQDEACARGLVTQTVLGFGNPAQTLASVADEHKAEVVALSADPRGTLHRLLVGSVPQSLAIAAHQSVLVARGCSVKGAGPVRAVFATDHSDYANAALEKFLRWAPKGLGHVRVVTAYVTMGHEVATTGSREAVRADEIDRFVNDRVAAKTAEIAERFRADGIEADSRAVRGHPNQVIRDAMEEAGADLLILGARGHGLWDRMTLGSTALHQMMAENYSMLIVRP